MCIVMTSRLRLVCGNLSIYSSDLSGSAALQNALSARIHVWPMPLIGSGWSQVVLPTWISELRKGMVSPAWQSWYMIRQSDNQLIGACWFQASGGQRELWIEVLVEHHGYGSEALAGITSWLFANSQIMRIPMETSETNVWHFARSVHIIIKGYHNNLVQCDIVP